tara:strand:- start:288 stop:500 length:213 start_codon:yes stop_codon:yes gene_type:complete
MPWDHVVNAFYFPIPKMTLGLIIGIFVFEDTAIPWIALLTALSRLIIALTYIYFKKYIRLEYSFVFQVKP